MQKLSGKALVVDDAPASLQVISDLLTEAGVEVRCARDGREAKAAIEEWNPDVLVTDLQMPHASGLELIAHVRQMRKTMGIVVVSAFATQASRDELQKHLVDAVLSKPEGLSQLLPVMEGLLSPDRARGGRQNDTAMSRILVIDDHAQTRELIRDICESAGHEVDEASDGKEALEKAAAEDYHLIFTDIHMPNMDGIETITRIREMTPRAFVVSMTGEAGLTEREQTKLAGAYTCLRKPFDVDALKELVGRFTRVASHRRAYHEREDQRRQEMDERPWIEKVKAELRQEGVGKSHVLILALAAAFGVALAILLGAWTSKISDRIDGLDSFMGRIEGYLDRDEQREIKRNR